MHNKNHLKKRFSGEPSDIAFGRLNRMVEEGVPLALCDPNLDEMYKHFSMCSMGGSSVNGDKYAFSKLFTELNFTRTHKLPRSKSEIR